MPAIDNSTPRWPDMGLYSFGCLLARTRLTLRQHTPTLTRFVWLQEAN